MPKSRRDDCTIYRFDGGEYYYDGGCGDSTFVFSITCDDNIFDDGGGCVFSEVSVSRQKTASPHLVSLDLES